MLTLTQLQHNTAEVKTKLTLKNFANPNLVDEILKLDITRKQLQTENDNLLAIVNTASKQIGALLKTGPTLAETLKQDVAMHKATIQLLTQQLQTTEAEIQQLLVTLPNLPHHSVPAGFTATDNITVKEIGTIPSLPANAKPHWELIKDYKLVDFETAAKLSGSGFALYSGNGAKLQRALVSYFLAANTAAGYTEYSTPYLVNTATAYGTGQLPDKEGQMYTIEADGLYLIPTSEVTLTNIYAHQIIPTTNLPLKLTAHSHCFRREAGSFGADVRGLNRVHQFEKVEIVQLVPAADSYTVLEQMVAHVESLLLALELPYRILRLCAGDMSFASALTYDFEVYSAAQQKWLEVSSVSNFETYQTNRMKIRTKNADGKTELLHSLNGSALALPRIVAALLENNQTETEIKLPAILHQYYGNSCI